MITYGPVGVSGRWLVKKDGKKVDGFSGINAGRSAKKLATTLAAARGKTPLETRFPGSPPPAPAKPAEAPPAPKPPQAAPPSMSLKALKASLAAGDLDGELDDLFAAETASDKPRKGAFAAIKARRASLQE